MSTKSIPASNTTPATAPAVPNATLLANANLPLGKSGDFLTCLGAILVGLNGQVDASALLPTLQALAGQTGSHATAANTAPATAAKTPAATTTPAASLVVPPVQAPPAPRKIPAVLLPVQTYYDWMTTHKSRTNNPFIPLLALRLAATPDFPRSDDLTVNCSMVRSMDLTADELAAFVRSWHLYEDAMRHRRYALALYGQVA